jgi:hypothetical protein
MRADEYGAENDTDGQRVWVRIVEAINSCGGRRTRR